MSADAVQRLRAALAGTSEAERPLARFDLPEAAEGFLHELASRSLTEAAVLVPILARDDRHALLLTRRAETLRQHKGQISFPGGRRDVEDRSLAAAALREAHEEVGLTPSSVEILGYLDDYPTITGYRITPVVGLVRGADFMPRTDPGEVAATFELPLATLAGPDPFERKAFSRAGLNIPFLELNFGPHRIWGATAGILWDLRQRLEGP